MADGWLSRPVLTRMLRYSDSSHLELTLIHGANSPVNYRIRGNQWLVTARYTQAENMPLRPRPEWWITAATRGHSTSEQVQCELSTPRIRRQVPVSSQHSKNVIYLPT